MLTVWGGCCFSFRTSRIWTETINQNKYSYFSISFSYHMLQ